jgi:ribose transport system substrate-binding protein
MRSGELELCEARGILIPTMSRRLFNSVSIHGLSLLIVLAGLIGCRRSKRPMIAVIPETTAQEIWESAHFGAVRIANQWNWDIYWNGPSREDDLPEQIKIVDREIERGVQGIILAPDHAVALISPVSAAVAKGIPVAILNTPLAASPGNDVAFVLNDDVATGRIAAERVSHYLKGSDDEVAIVGIDPNFLGSLYVADAMKDALHKREPGIHLVEQRSTTFGPIEAADEADELLHGHPSLRAIVALNVAQTRAVYSALRRANLLRKVALIGCEQDFDVVYKVRIGDMDSVIAKDTGTMVRDAMMWIRRHRDGNVKGETIIVLPQLVTRENVDSVEIQRVLAVSGSEP